MALVAKAAPSPCLVVDVDTKLTDTMLTRLTAARPQGKTIRGIGRYIGLEGNGPSDIDIAELSRICAHGFGCFLMQHVMLPGWVPTASLGNTHGKAALANVTKAGYPVDAHVVLDIEGIEPGTPASDVIAYCDEWANEVKARNRPLLYVGYNTFLTPEQLWELPDFHAYGKDWGQHTVPHRGFVWEQTVPDVTLIPGVRFDLGQVQQDQLGSLLYWCEAA